MKSESIMVNAVESRRKKAAAIRYKKPIVKGLNFDDINGNLCDMQEECEDVKWFCDDDDTLVNALDGNEDEAFEFKMMFGDLCAECEQLREDLNEVMWHDETKEAFNSWFPAIGGGEMIGWDFYETDYMPITGGYEQELAGREGRKRIMRMKKEERLDTAELSFRVIRSYLGLVSRYDQLKAAMDILRDQNTGYLQLVKQIEAVYEKANESEFYDWDSAMREFDQLIKNMPQEAWI